MKNKKGQAGTDFLMTYGWAILVVLAAIGAMAYLDIFTPSIETKCLQGHEEYCWMNKHNETISENSLEDYGCFRLHYAASVDVGVIKSVINKTNIRLADMQEENYLVTNYYSSEDVKTFVFNDCFGE